MERFRSFPSTCNGNLILNLQIFFANISLKDSNGLKIIYTYLATVINLFGNMDSVIAFMICNDTPLCHSNKFRCLMCPKSQL